MTEHATRPPIEQWIRRELKRCYDTALDEALPVELLDLIGDSETLRRS